MDRLLYWRNKVAITLNRENERSLLTEIKQFFLKERDEELSDFQAKLYLEFILQRAGVYIYNQAIADAQQFFGEKVEELFVLEKQIEEKTARKTHERAST